MIHKFTIRQRVIAAASEIGKPSLFRHDGCSLTEFSDLIKHEINEFVVAGKIVEYFCVSSDGKFNNFTRGIILCLYFLTKGYVMDDDDFRHAATDLKTVVETSEPNIGEEVEKWARLHFA